MYWPRMAKNGENMPNLSIMPIMAILVPIWTKLSEEKISSTVSKIMTIFIL
jgi:hypothetical protein